MSVVLLDYFLHLDTHLYTVIQQYGIWVYLLLLLIVFCETGLVVTPFLPGDSLLFAAGAMAAKGMLSFTILFMIFVVAAIIGDSVNYSIGKRLGRKAFALNWRFLNHEHLMRAEEFYERQGAKTIIIARFLPIIRTFAPFVAGIGVMHYATFLTYNVIGGLLWVILLLGGGYLFGNIPMVERNFSAVILAIIAISLLPGIVPWLRRKK